VNGKTYFHIAERSIAEQPNIYDTPSKASVSIDIRPDARVGLTVGRLDRPFALA